VPVEVLQNHFDCIYFIIISRIMFLKTVNIYTINEEDNLT
jgi:hypothetical protein